LSSETARKAAVALLCMGEDAATEVCKHLSEDQLRALARAVTGLGQVSDEERRGVCRELSARCKGPDGDVGGAGHLRRVLDRVTGPAKAASILEAPAAEDAPFGFAEEVGAAQLAALVSGEHPQTIALVLRHVRPATAAQVIATLPPEAQVEVVRRVACSRETSVEAVRHVDASIRRLLATNREGWREAASGVESAVEILRNLDRDAERSLLDRLCETAPEVADEISGALLGFEHVFELDDRAIRLVLGHLDARQIALALKGAPRRHVEVILRNLSARAAKAVEDELKSARPFTRREVDEAQEGFVRTLLELADAGELVVDGAEEEFVE
jgi:flagellar motor switch protein FliG